jgi:PAS domain S-box-containing protein
MSRNTAAEEIASLKSRIVTLEQLLGVRERMVLDQTDRLEASHQTLREQTDLLRALVSATDPSHQEDFFHALVYHLAAALKVRYAVVGELCPVEPGGQVRTIAVLANGEFAPNFTYDLQGMPCAHLVHERVCYFEKGIQQRFPRAQMMKDFGAEGYCGVPIYGKSGSPIGILAVLDSKVLQLSSEVQSLLMLFASRAGVELERRKADEALHISEERYGRATAAGKVGVWELDCSTGTYYGDSSLKALYGYQEQELGTDPLAWLNLVLPDDRMLATDAWQAVASGERDDYLCELRMQRKDGGLCWTEARGQAVRDAQGRLLRLIGATVDITERKSAEEALARTHQDLQNVTETVPDVLYTLSTEGRLIKWNKRAEVVTGFSANELRNRLALSFVPETEQAMIAEAIQRAFREGYAEAEGHLLTKDGKAIPYHWTGATLKDQQDHVIGLTGVGRDISEQKRIEASLRESEERYRMLVDFLPSGVFVYCEDRTAYLNQAGARILGAASPIEITDNPTFEFVHPDYREQVFANAQRILSGGEAIHRAERIYLKMDGTPIEVEVEAAPITWKGKPAIQGIFSDITERKQAEEALAQRERELRTVLDALPVGVWFTDAQGKVALANPAARAILAGAKQVSVRDTEQDLRWWEFTGPSAEPHRWALTHALVKHEASLNDLLEIECLDGTRKTINSSSVPVRDEAGRITGAIVVNEDITERKRVEELLRRSEERYRTLIDTVEGVVWEVDVPTFRFTFVSSQAERLFGYPLAQWYEPDFWGSHLHPADREWAIQFCLVETRAQRAHAFEYRMIAADGRVVWVHDLVSVVLVDGKPAKLRGLLMDITARKRAEEALRQRERDLQHAMEERARISQDLHDGILQSLYAVGLGLEACKPLLKQQQQQQQRKKTTANLSLALDQAIRQLNQVMRQVRNFIAGLESDLLRGQDLPAALRNLAGSLQSASTRIRLAVDNRAAQSLSTDQALHILNVVKEALSNSLRHSHAQLTTVSLKMLKGGVRLTVRDNGVGFHSDRRRGGGYGLANMAARAEKIGGRFAICSKPRHGTRVIFDLPKEPPVAHV